MALLTVKGLTFRRGGGHAAIDRSPRAVTLYTLSHCITAVRSCIAVDLFILCRLGVPRLVELVERDIRRPLETIAVRASCSSRRSPRCSPRWLISNPPAWPLSLAPHRLGIDDRARMTTRRAPAVHPPDDLDRLLRAAQTSDRDERAQNRGNAASSARRNAQVRPYALRKLNTGTQQVHIMLGHPPREHNQRYRPGTFSNSRIADSTQKPFQRRFTTIG